MQIQREGDYRIALPETEDFVKADLRRDDRKGLRMDICENGIKDTTWEMTRNRVDRGFFAAHTTKELTGWTGSTVARCKFMKELLAHM